MRILVERIVLSVVAGFAVFTLWRILATFHLFDFAIYYQSVLDLKHGINMYADPTIAMKYPLSGMLVLYPIGWLPYVLAEKIWTLFSVACLGISGWYLAAMVPQLGRREWMYILGAVVLSFPYKFTLGMGQINLLILALLSGALYYGWRDKAWLAGSLLGVAAWIKITPLLILLYFWRKRAYTVVAATLLVYILGWMLAGLFWGFDLVVYFWHSVVPTISMVGNYVYYNQALTGLLARSGVVDHVAQFLNYLLLLILLTCSYRATPIKRMDGASEMCSYGLFVVSMILGSGLAWQHYFVWTLILFVGLYTKLWQRHQSQRLYFLLLLLAYVLISINIADPSSVPSHFNLMLSHMTLGSLLLWGLGFMCLTKIRSL